MVRVFIYPKLFVCSFLHFLVIVTIQICDTTGSRAGEPINYCHIMFIIVYSSFNILNLVFIEFIY